MALLEAASEAGPANLLAQSLGVFDHHRYAGMAVERKSAYQSADPFPHASFRDFLPLDLAHEARAAFPGPDDIPWHTSQHDKARKRYQFEGKYFPPVIRAICTAFASSRFLLFLEELTGIESLIPDPHLVGGGLHLVGTGGTLQVHADFNWHHKLQLHRRVNVLWYLSDDWDESWGGALEFWDHQTNAERARVYPHFNSLAVFSTGSTSLHGHPRPLTCPQGVYRRALNFYYYTQAPVPADVVAPHWTRYLSDKPGSNEVKAADPYAVDASPFAATLRERFLKGQ